MARELGADVREIEAVDPVEGIVQLGGETQVTQVLVGHAQQPRWMEPLRESLVMRLLRRLSKQRGHAAIETLFNIPGRDFDLTDPAKLCLQRAHAGPIHLSRSAA